MKTSIYYFSGTGNSYACAFKLKEMIEDSELHPIKQDIESIESERIILVVPTYAYGLPKLVLKTLKKCKINCQYFAVIATCGTIPGGLFFQVYKILKRKKIKLNYYAPISTVENYFAIFKRDSLEEEAKQLIDQDIQTEIVAQKILNLDEEIKPKRKTFLRMISWVFLRGLPVVNSFIKIRKNCAKCGLCVEKCPANALYFKKNKLKIRKRKCQNCQGCINRCPLHAITFFKIKKDTPRYLHPILKGGVKNEEK